ncbi:hypothetical protein [Candidatus Pantoea multigeneris]|uniref:Uncharacterized protein n=1 Tax=Candidatus Pantoea multigeneris TaxID=2608357 RepID=A0ABX0RAT9_9GAMM|nr:hypothetical protein [Pantoea multigeneris]NIF20594.1 hypothetical protein [Pantoea multigeneris]
MEIIKYLIPLITFLLGMLLTPYIEGLKEKRKNRILKDNIWIELHDELINLKGSIKETDKNISFRKNKIEKLQYLNLPQEIELLILSDKLKEIYPYLTREQRLACKTLIKLQDSINEKREEVIKNYLGSNSRCQRLEEAMLKEKLSMYYLINQLIHSKDKFTRPTESNDHLILKAAASLDIQNKPSRTNN